MMAFRMVLSSVFVGARFVFKSQCGNPAVIPYAFRLFFGSYSELILNCGTVTIEIRHVLINSCSPRITGVLFFISGRDRVGSQQENSIKQTKPQKIGVLVRASARHPIGNLRWFGDIHIRLWQGCQLPQQ